MVRPSRPAQLDEPSPDRGRLEAMRLPARTPGWVPALPAEETAPDLSAPRPDEAPYLHRGPPSAAPSSLPAPSIGELMRAWALDRLPLWTHGRVERVGRSGLVAAVALVVAAIVAGVVMFHHGSAATYSSSYDDSGSSSSAASSPATSVSPITGGDATSIVVDVGGRVRKPGLVTLPAGARVADAIAAAGGPLHHKEIATLDLAARVTDGQLLLVGVPAAATTTSGSASGTDPSAGSSAAPVDLDTATIEELETLPGVGPVTAQKIIDWRSAHSGFTTVEQLQQVPGIGPARYAELSPLVTP